MPNTGYRDRPHGRCRSERDGSQLRPQDLESDLEAAHRDRDGGGGRGRVPGQAQEERDRIGKRGGNAGQQQADEHGATHIAAVTPGILPQDRQTEPAGDEGVEDDGECHSEHVNAVVVRVEQARKHNDVQQPEDGREHVGKEVDRCLADQHDVGTTQPRRVRSAGVARGPRLALPAIADRNGGRDRSNDISAAPVTWQADKAPRDRHLLRAVNDDGLSQAATVRNLYKRLVFL